jgi:peroxiredoxin
MKKLLLIAISILPAAAMAQKPFSIEGTLKKPSGTEKVYLVYFQNGKSLIDSTELKNGSFSFSGTVADPVRASVYRKPVEKNGKSDFVSFYIEGSAIRLITADSLRNASITGSQANIDGDKLNALTKSLQDQLAVVNGELGRLSPEQKKDKVLTDSIYKRYRAITKKLEPIYLDFARKNTTSFLSLTAISQVLTSESVQTEAEQVYNGLSEALRSSKTGKDIWDYLNTAKKTKIGVQAIDFTQNDVEDKPVKLSDFKGKYVLLDFWASWCGPCRQENPNVVAAYNQYKDKGFTVLGVSLDQPGKKASWLKAIADDHLTWTHVSDLKFWDNAVAKEYGIRGIPANFLIGPDGKIIAKGLRGEALKEKLASLLDAKSK